MLFALLSTVRRRRQGKRVVVPLCGGNVDTPVLGRVLERGLATDGRLFRCGSCVRWRGEALTGPMVGVCIWGKVLGSASALLKAPTAAIARACVSPHARHACL